MQFMDACTGLAFMLWPFFQFSSSPYGIIGGILFFLCLLLSIILCFAALRNQYIRRISISTNAAIISAVTTAIACALLFIKTNTTYALFFYLIISFLLIPGICFLITFRFTSKKPRFLTNFVLLLSTCIAVAFMLFIYIYLGIFILNISASFDNYIENR